MNQTAFSLRDAVVRHLDFGFLSAGIILLALWLTLTLETKVYQEEQSRRLDDILAESPPAPTPFIAARARAEAGVSGLVGRLQIPRLKLEAVVAEGMDDGTLKHAVGHIPKTAFPGESGNVGLAAHRDSFFRPLKGIAAGDTVRLTTPDGIFGYVVDTTFVVLPEQVDVLYPTAEPALTLVTCYPFNYIGKAPKRFIVRGRPISPLENESTGLVSAPGRPVSSREEKGTRAELALAPVSLLRR